MQQFYLSYLTKDDTEIHFDKTESKHLSRVLRKKVGDTITITNGIGYRFTATLCESQTMYSCYKSMRGNQDQILSFTFFIAPTKSNDRMDWFVEKATEIGIHEITPIICQRSDRKVVKQERLQKIAICNETIVGNLFTDYSSRM